MEESFVCLFCCVSLACSIGAIIATRVNAEDYKEHCYYCEHVELEENNGYCFNGKHYILEDGVLKEIGECFAK